MEKKYDVIVVGAGHAGCEAALATARMGWQTLLLTMNVDTVGKMSCNPAIGGLAKGHLVKEIDALGGEMARNIDKTGIQFRRLNTSKGPAVRSSRAQADMGLYSRAMREVVEYQSNLTIKQTRIEQLVVEQGRIQGVVGGFGAKYRSSIVILTTGTFTRGLCHIGLKNFKAGRMGDKSAEGISGELTRLGFELGRLKTGTPPRLDGRTIDFKSMEVQWGDDPPRPFAFFGTTIVQPQVCCYITHTNSKTHEIILENLHRSPMYNGRIKAVGPRYCPSIEDKVHRFAERDRHQIFLEPQELTTQEFYPNGISTSLPFDVQEALVRTIAGLEKVEIVRPGYAVEYDFVFPTQIRPSLETKLVSGLFLAGQINGTSGYEEAAIQGLLAGINAANKLADNEPLILQRNQAYGGVLVDDLVTKGTEEPYRMFTSRAEYRLLLREDNADERLMPIARKAGLIGDETWGYFESKQRQIRQLKTRLHQICLRPDATTNDRLRSLGFAILKNKMSLAELLRRPKVTVANLSAIAAIDLPSSDPAVGEQVEIQIKYEGYISRQHDQIARFEKLERISIPAAFNYADARGFSQEVKEKLSTVQPTTIGQASRISGVTPAAISTLMIHLKQHKAG